MVSRPNALYLLGPISKSRTGRRLVVSVIEKMLEDYLKISHGHFLFIVLCSWQNKIQARREEAYKVAPRVITALRMCGSRVCFNGLLKQIQEKLSSETKRCNVSCPPYVSGFRQFLSNTVHRTNDVRFKLWLTLFLGYLNVSAHHDVTIWARDKYSWEVTVKNYESNRKYKIQRHKESNNTELEIYK